MRSRLFAVTIFLLLPVTGLAVTVVDVEAQSDGVRLVLDQGTLKLQVIDSQIIRVLVLPTSTPLTRKSLIAEEKERAPAKWTWQESDQEISLRTAKLKVCVQRATAEIGFFTLKGKPILLERQGGGKRITPAEVCGEKTYHIRQQWQSPPDECIYGLGHHQHGLLNQRGADIDLWQENWEVVVPMFTSSRG